MVYIVNDAAVFAIFVGELSPVAVGQPGIEASAGDEDSVHIGAIQTAIVRGDGRQVVL